MILKKYAILVVFIILIFSTGLAYGSLNLNNKEPNKIKDQPSFSALSQPQDDCGQVITPPNSIESNRPNGSLESNNHVYIINEGTTTLNNDLDVDITQSGLVDTSSNLSIGTIQNGTQINSFLIHYDKIGSGSPRKYIKCTITFEQDILGIITQDEKLDKTDSTLGVNTTTYDTGLSYRGLEFNRDNLTLDKTQNTITIGFGVTHPYDQIRVITKTTQTQQNQKGFTTITTLISIITSTYNKNLQTTPITKK